MAINDVALTGAMRANLLQLQGTETKISQKQNILATGNKINSALDGPTAYFAAKGLTQRAGDLSALKDSMGQAVSTIKSADKGLTAIESLVEQARGLTTAAYSALGNDAGSVATRKTLASQFNALKQQIDKLAEDSGYQGKNLLNGNGLRLDSTSASRVAVNSVVGLENARVTNVVGTDTYTVRVKGDGSIEGAAGDISKAEMAHGLTGLKMSGTMSTSLGNFSDVSIEVRGATGRQRTFIVSDGVESRTITYFDDNQTIAANTTVPAKSNQAQLTTVTLGGTIEAGDIFSITIEGQTFSYTATTADVNMTTTAKMSIATKLQQSISTAISSGRLSGTTY
ncbi:MAG TPA: flagellin, partial [Azospirillum sp.]|nr:flagellin [Azospirillum sp.]